MSDPYTPGLSHPEPARKSKVISDTTNHTGLNASMVQVIEGAVLTSITAPQKENASGLVGPTLAAGLQISGPITQIQLASGTVEAHESH